MPHLPRPSAELSCRLPTAFAGPARTTRRTAQPAVSALPHGKPRSDSMPSYGPLTTATVYSPRRLCVADIGGQPAQRAYRVRAHYRAPGHASPSIDHGGPHSRETYLPAIGDSRMTQDLSAPDTASPSGALRLRCRSTYRGYTVERTDGHLEESHLSASDNWKTRDLLRETDAVRWRSGVYRSVPVNADFCLSSCLRRSCVRTVDCEEC